MTKFKIVNFLIPFCLLSNAVNAQNVKAVVGQVNQVQIKLENQKSDQCNVEVTFPNGSKSEFVTSKPDYVVDIEFNPTIEGLNTIAWQGKLRLRGLKSVGSCDGNGKLIVSAVPNNDTKIQRWREVVGKASDKQKTCLNAGLKIAGENFDVNALTGEIKNDANEPISKEIRSRCEKFADVVLAKNSACKINEKQTFCDEYFEITIGGSKRQFSDNELLEFLFRKEQVQKLSVENPDAKNKREIAEAEEARKLEAYKKTPAYKKEQSELAKKQAVEEARIKKEQAEQEKLLIKQAQDRELALKNAAEEKRKSFASKNFKVMFICNTEKVGNQYAHEDFASNMLRTLVMSPNLYPQMISSHDDCKASNQQMNNYDLLEKQGKILYKQNGNQYILLKIGNFSTAGVVGLE